MHVDLSEHFKHCYITETHVEHYLLVEFKNEAPPQLVHTFTAVQSIQSFIAPGHDPHIN